MHPKHTESGLSLVELMIGMLIGLILLGGVVQTLLVSKEAQRSRDNMAVVTDNARFLFEFMARDLRMAGRGFGTANWDAAVMTEPLQEAGGTLAVGYYTDANGGEFIRATYRYDAANQRILYSRSGSINNAETLVDGIANFGLEYGVHTETAPGNFTISYQDAASVADWGDVASVRVNLGLVDGNTPGNARLLTSTLALRNRVANIYSPE